MARKYEYLRGRYAWNLEMCEEEIVIAAYDDIRRFVPAQQTWALDFEHRFFEQGDGLAVEFIDDINVVRKRRGLDILEIRETDVSDYGRWPDKQLRSNHRRQVREELSRASVDHCRRRIEAAKAEAERLPPPRFTYEEYKMWQERIKARPGLSGEEISKRNAAQEAATALRHTAKPTLSPARAARMLKVVSPDVWPEIIPKLSPDDALEVAEKVTDAQLRDALIMHSLGSSK